MSIEIPKELRNEALASLQRYMAENFDVEMGNVAAGAMLGYILEEIGPLAYNAAVIEVQERLLARVQEIDIDVHEEPLRYWQQQDQVRRRR